MGKINGRAKGHAYERKIAQEFRDMGFDKCQTARYESKMLDDLKVDLTNTGNFQIQCKAAERGVYPHDILSSMPQNGKINAVFHKRNRKGEVVTISKDDFYKLLKHYECNETEIGGRSGDQIDKLNSIIRK